MIRYFRRALLPLALVLVWSAPVWAQCNVTINGVTMCTSLQLSGVGKLADGTAAAPSLTFTSDPDTGFWWSASNTNQIQWAAGGASAGFLSSTSVRLLNDSGVFVIGSAAATAVNLTRIGDGKIQLSGGTTTTPMLLFGGSTSSFPALKRSGNVLQSRLADDSGYGGLKGSNVAAFSAFQLGTADAVVISATAPTISSGFGTNPSIAANNGTAAFTVNVGTGGTASSGVIGLPTATTGWICKVENRTAVAANRGDQRTVQTASTPTTATVQNQTVSTGAALAWTASDVLAVQCMAY